MGIGDANIVNLRGPRITEEIRPWTYQGRIISIMLIEMTTLHVSGTILWAWVLEKLIKHCHASLCFLLEDAM